MQTQTKMQDAPTSRQLEAMQDLLHVERTKSHTFQGRSGKEWSYIVRGLNAGTMDEIAGLSANKLRMENGEPVANLNSGLYYHNLLKYGVIEAPYPWTDENIRATPAHIRDVLIRSIRVLSDALQEEFLDVQKNSDAPSEDSPTETPASIHG